MVVSEITIKKSGDSFFIRGCPNEAGDIPTFKELSPKSASTEIIQKINEVNEFALEFSEQGDFQEFIAENGTKYRLFKTEGESFGIGYREGLHSQTNPSTIDNIRRLLSKLGRVPKNPNVWYIKTSNFRDSYFTICIGEIKSGIEEINGIITIDIGFVNPENEPSVIVNRMVVSSAEFLRQIFKNQFHLRFVFEEAKKKNEELMWRNGDYSTVFPEKSKAPHCKTVVHPEGINLCQHSYARELLRLNSET